MTFPDSALSASTSQTPSQMDESPLRIAVTGASGYIAGRLIRKLQGSERVAGILATDIRPPSVQFSRKVKFMYWDVTVPRPDLFADHRIDTVVHLAFILNPARRKTHARRVNVAGTDNVLESCKEAGVRHVTYLSSSSVYGAHPDNPPFLTENDPIRPVKGFQYSEDKAAVESRLLEFAERSPEATVTILRVCPVMGPNADNFIAKAFRKPFLPAIGADDPSMQFIHEDDLTRALEQCMKYRPRGIYNVAGDGAIPWSEMVAAMNRPILRLPAPVWYSLTSAAWHLRLQNDSPACGLDFIRYRWRASSQKLKSELDIEFQHTSRTAWESYTVTKNR